MNHQTCKDQNSMDSSQLPNKQEAKIKGLKLKCIENNQAVYGCTNEKCKEKSIFTCANKDCKCQLEHELCSTVKFNNIINVIERKTLQTGDIKEFINLSFDRMIDQLSEQRQKLLDEVETKLKFTYQTQVQKQFLKFVYEQQKILQLNRQGLALLWKVATNKKIAVNNLFNDTKELIKKIIGQLQNFTKQSIKVLNNQMSSKVDKELIKQQRRNNKMFNSFLLSKIQLATNEQTLISNIVKQSSIIRTVEDASRLIGFFPEPISKIQLISKENSKVSVMHFYYRCRQVQNTIILLRTGGNKIVGGYTPLSYYQQNLKGNNVPISDLSEESFMFSLTNNDKFCLKDKQHAIQLGAKNDAICFGSSQIYIPASRWDFQTCYINFNGSYQNQKYVRGEKQSYLRFNGSESYSCEISNFQVWKVQMYE